ncbi:MAG: hypothetical protein AW10_00461 [Candidatus Accumulibacter appositus]|uniref:Lipoprotein n=2 Tax=Candidatus Accumulibacter TaxID=327159 RepID=A0A011NHV2_9PROT|nr:MAG: hypothetical protein AW10_00461 [Candidatus Accumulibacter appositus]
MRLPMESLKRHSAKAIVLFSALVVTGCGQPEPPPASALTDDMRAFTGNWTATGTRQVLDLGPGRQTGTFQLSGAMMLSGKQRLNLAFRAEVIGFSDPMTGLVGRSVWTDDRGDKVFSELRGEGVGPGKLIDGKFTGGTGRYSGLSGEYSFRWQRIGSIQGNELTGRVVGLNGWARLGSPEAVAPTTSGGQQ